MRDASRGSGAAHEFKIDAGLARFQAQGRRSERLFAGRARRARVQGGRGRRPSRRLLRRLLRARLGRLGLGRLGLGGRWACWLGRRLARFRRSGEKRIRQARRIDADQLGADSQHVADSAAESKHAACHGSWNVDRRLVGHDGGDDLILLDEIADLDRPFDDLGFRNPFADVGHLDRAHAHHEASMAFKSARPTRAGPGK